MLVQLLGSAELLQLALVHDGDAVAHRHRLDLVVRHVDGRRAEALLQPEDLGTRLDAQRCVEVGERLVHEERLRLADDRPPERDPLALAAGELLRLALEEVAELERVGGLPDTPVDLGLGHAVVAKAEGEVVVHRHVWIEGVRLEDHGHVPSARRDVVDDAVADEDPAARDLLESGEHPQRGRLAAARRADEDEELAVGDVDAEVVDGGGLVEPLGDVLERDRRHQTSLASAGSTKCATATKE